MRLPRIVMHRIDSLLRRSRAEADLEREIKLHIEQLTKEYVAEGMGEPEARLLARREFGPVDLTKEQCRDARRIDLVEDLRKDLGFAFRLLAKSPGFTVAAVLSLALGIGATTAIFSLLDAVLLRPLPVAAPAQLVQFATTLSLWDTGGSDSSHLFAYPQLERFETGSKALSGIFGGTTIGSMSLGFRGTTGIARADAYTGNFFSVLGVVPQHGRLFSAGEDRADASVAVISDRYWRNRFGADASIVGGPVTIGQVPFTVIGITPPDFLGISVGYCPDVWIPLHALDRLQPDGRRWTEPFSSWMLIAGRLRPEISQEQAQAEIDVIHRRYLAEQLPLSEIRSLPNAQRFAREGHLQLLPAAGGTDSGLRNRYAFPLKMLMWVAGILLLVACANVASLLLARASNRRREIAVRLALGASRGRLMRQLLTESIVLAGIGGALAVPMAWWGSLALVRMISTGDSPVALVVTPDWRIFAFAAAVSLATGILFGLAPAVRGTGVPPGPAMKEGTGHASRSIHTLDRVLVAAQVALSVILITGAGLFVRTLQKLWSVDVGYDRENVLMFSVDARLAGYPSDRDGAVYREILRRMQMLPGVKSAGASIVRPADDAFNLIDRVDQVDGRTLPERAVMRVAWNAISPGYFSAVSTPVVAGRDFEQRDNETAPKVVIVNESLARIAFPDQSAIGHRLGMGTVVGIVRDSHYGDVRERPGPVLYYPLGQQGPDQAFRWGFVSYELRCSAQTGLLDEVRREVASVDRNLPVFRAKTLVAQTEQSLLKERLLATLSSFFGSLALLLACVGLYGLMAYAVAGRTAEIAIRLSLGAQRGHIIWLVLRETLWLTLAGIAAGIPLALWAAGYVKGSLFGISANDPLTIAAAIAALLGVAALAGYLPARRALRVDPMVGLRAE